MISLMIMDLRKRRCICIDCLVAMISLSKLHSCMRRFKYGIDRLGLTYHRSQ